MRSQTIIGPEHPTLAERFIAVFRLPYVASCVLVVLILGHPGEVLVRYLETLDIARAVAETLALPPGLWLFNVLSFYFFYGPRYMRRKVLQAEESLSPLLPNGERDFHKIFGGISALKPEIVAWMVTWAALLITFYFVPLSSLRITPPTSSTPRFAWTFLAVTVFSIGISSVLWTYLRSLWGIHKIGSFSMEFKPYYLDRNLGLKPVGSLALSLVMLYFGGISISIIQWILSVQSSVAPTWGDYATLSIAILLGLMTFFLPMTRLHRRMLQQKKVEIDKLNEQIAHVFGNPARVGSAEHLGQVLTFEMMERKIASIATWPYDIQILRTLFAIVSSVIAVLISTGILRLIFAD